MKTTQVIGLVFVLAMAGCGGDKAAKNVEPSAKSEEEGMLMEGASSKNGRSNPVPLAAPKRPASNLASVTADVAWKTPLNLARFTVQQKTNKRWINEAWHQLVIALARSGELEQAEEVSLLFSRDSGDRAMLYLVKVAAESGDVKQALKVARWIGSARTRIYALCHAAEAQAKAGYKKEALATVREASGLMRSVPQKDKASPLISIAEAQSAMGDSRAAAATCELALERVHALKNDFFSGGYYKRIGAVLIDAGEIQKTKQMIRFGNDLMGQAMSGSARKDIAVLMAEKGKVEAALEWVGQFPTNDTPRQQDKDGAYTDIAIMLAKQGKPNRAMEVMNKVKIRIIGWRQDLVKLAGAMAEGGALEEAMKLFQQNRRAAGEETLRILATAQFAAGQKEPALQLLDQATQAAEEGGIFQLSKHVLLETVALAYVEAGETEQAAVVLKKAVAAARVYEKTKYSNSSKESAVSKRLLDLISTAKKVGDKELTAAIMDEALRLAREGKSYTSAAVKLVALQDYPRAMVMARLHENDKSLKGAMRQMAEPLTRKEELRSSDVGWSGSTLKKSFTAEEQAFAKQLVEAMEKGK